MSITLMACGGAAANIVSQRLYESSKSNENKGFSKLDVKIIDTSRSNLSPIISEEDFYHIKGIGNQVVDGGGKLRFLNYEAAETDVPDILRKFPPGDLTILLHSASGGSGSLLSPLIASELLSKDHQVIVLQIGSSLCQQEVINTINTLKSYVGISQKYNKPILSAYYENSKQTPMGIVDALVDTDVLLISALYSGRNQGLDSTDLKNFINYQNVSNYRPGLTLLKIYHSDTNLELSRGEHFSTIVTLAKSANENIDPGVIVPYHSFGYLSSDALSAFGLPDSRENGGLINTPIHYATIQGTFSNILNKLIAKNNEIEESFRVNPVQNLTITDKTTDKGLVL
jgi:hypothetical protein